MGGQFHPPEMAVAGSNAKEKLVAIIENKLVPHGFVDILVNVDGLSRITGHIYADWQYGYLFAPGVFNAYYLKLSAGVITVYSIPMSQI